MVDSTIKMAVLGKLKSSDMPLSLPEISELIHGKIPQRTLRRWLAGWVEQGVLVRSGKKRGTRYAYVGPRGYPSVFESGFLNAVPAHRRLAVLEQIRDLWTHTSTALEGNSLTLGDTHAVLGLGLTISGKPLREHQEIVGHAKAIDLLYQGLHKPLDKDLILDLHRAVQTDIVLDIYKPVGEWKLEINGTYAVTGAGQQVFIEYAKPAHVDGLMDELIRFINDGDMSLLTLDTAAEYYAKVHMGVVHIHPFWDGNGRIARLLANLLLLKAGLPPLVIGRSLRREYITCLADYQVSVGQLSDRTGVWPDGADLKEFIDFCQAAYASTRNLIEAATA